MNMHIFLALQTVVIYFNAMVSLHHTLIYCIGLLPRDAVVQSGSMKKYPSILSLHNMLCLLKTYIYL